MGIRQKIIDDLVQERNRQDGLWGTEFDDRNTANDWIAYAINYLSVAAYDSKDKKFTLAGFEENVKKAMAICCAALETLERNGSLPPRHYDRLDVVGGK